MKVFPETSRTSVYAYLGIPYAQPPIGDLRFSAPLPHIGWNRTLFARNYKPLCPELDNNIYEEIEYGFNYNNKITNEDCLFLNIWSPETAFRYGKFPVLVMITGEEMSFDWLINRPVGLDLASEGIIVVTVQYRTNIFGWFTLENEDAPGNLGLLDQNLALVWIKENIHKFGGDPNKITLLGHGTSGASNAMLHLASSKARSLFNQVIIMSGSVFSKFYDFGTRNGISPSEKVVNMLACDSPEKSYILKCMREKSVSDVLRAFDNIYKNGNYTELFGPVIDDFLSRTKKYIKDDPRKLIQTGAHDDIPILIGITNNEGAFIHEQWIDLAKQGFRVLKRHIDRTVVPHIQRHFGLFGMGQKQITEAINWKYFDQIPKSSAHLLNALQRLISEAKFEVPFYETIEILSKSWGASNKKGVENVTAFPITSPDLAGPLREKTNMYVYLFQQSNSMDMRGKINHFGGASHSSDLPFLLGPSLFQQIRRKKMSSSEEKLCKKIKGLFGDFIKTGNPTPGRLYDAWHPFTFSHKYIKILSSNSENTFFNKPGSSSGQQDSDEMNIKEIESMLNTNQDDVQFVTSDVSVAHNPYSLSSEKGIDQVARQSKSAVSFTETVQDSEYYYYLKKVYAFWDNFLPKLSKMLEQDREYRRDEDVEQELLLENGMYFFFRTNLILKPIICYSVSQIQTRIFLNANSGLPFTCNIMCLCLYPQKT